MSERGYCKYCDTVTNNIIKAYDDNHRMVWTGCLSCYVKRNELKDNVTKPQ